MSAYLDVHFTSNTAEHYTPRHIIDRVVACLGGIELDPCSNSHAAPNVPARRHYTAQDDGLAQEWRAASVYMNPPYGREVGRWVDKLVGEYEGKRIGWAIALLPARTDTRWWARVARYPVCFVQGRLKFSDAPGNAPFPSALVCLAPGWRRFAQHFGDIGHIYVPAIWEL